MKKIVLSLSALLLLCGSAAVAEDFENARETHEFDNPQDTQEHYQLRVGYSMISGTYTYEDRFGSITGDRDITGGSSFEVSLVAGKQYTEGFDYKNVYTIQSNKWSDADSSKEFSDYMFLGEGEIAYNINKYVSPFVGWYGGIGVTDASSFPNSSTELTYDLGFFAGISGDLYKGFGYYAKYNFYSWKGFNVANNTYGYRMSPTTIRIGASYTF